MGISDLEKTDFEESQEMAEEMYGEGDADVSALENYLTKQFRKKVSMVSL